MSQEEDFTLDKCQPPNKRTVLERQRRKRITTSCERLRKLLPRFAGRKNDMASILEMTVEYLRSVHEHLPEHQQSTFPGLPASTEDRCEGPSEALFPACVAQPVPGKDASDNTQSTQIPFRECERSGTVQASPQAPEVAAVEQSLTQKGTSLLKAGAPPTGVVAGGEPSTLPLKVSGALGHPKPPEEPAALLCEMGESSPLPSSTSQMWLTHLSVSPGPPSEEDFLADGLKRVPPGGPKWSCSEPGPQKEMLHAGTKLWKDEPEFKQEVERNSPSRATGALLQPELMSWASEQELLPERDLAVTAGFEMLFEDQPSAAWESKSSLHYLAAPEDTEMGFLEMYKLVALDNEWEP